MKVKCYWCGKVTEIEPLDDPWVKDGICQDCATRESRAFGIIGNNNPQGMR